MAKSQLALFLDKVKTDPKLKQRLLAAEEAAKKDADAAIRSVVSARASNLGVIKKIAKEEGFDISANIAAPKSVSVGPSALEKQLSKAGCWLTCCWVETSTKFQLPDGHEQEHGG
jgi:hypothetical protein